jgi:hypothetical protein
MTLNHIGALASALALMTAQGLAQAGTMSFNESTCVSGRASAASATCVTAVAGVKYAATLSAWNAPASGNFGSASIAYYSSSGLGVLARRESIYTYEHAIDNIRGTDALLINFSSANFALNQISIGWFSNDADVSILRYTGTSAPTLGNSTVANLGNAAGWDWVGDYSTLSTNSTLNFNTGNDARTAVWWLVSTYNSAYSTVPVPGSFGDANDYFKLKGFSGSVIASVPPSSDVPEPGTFALFGIALIGFAAARRTLRAK